jgi:uncharacterized protein YdhG (YjbR/CyaY superfamily)
MPTYYYGENVVHFAASKHHIGFYPTPSGIVKFEKEFEGYKKSKGGIRFPIDKPLPTILIKKVLEFRKEEIRKKLGA